MRIVAHWLRASCQWLPHLAEVEGSLAEPERADWLLKFAKLVLKIKECR